jgi:undecaprenyl-diphosphatase
MTVLQALLLGIVQGVTEFLPISSSGFLILVPEFLGWEVQSLAFDAIVHLGTLAAVVIGLFPEIRAILANVFKKKMNAWGKLGWMIVAVTIPVLLVGYFGNGLIEELTRSKEIVAFSFIVWGGVLYLADRMSKGGLKKVEKVSWKQAIAIGCAQVLALVPGTSRSGITITAGLFGKLNRETATRFSFLLGIPTIAAAGGYKLMETMQQGSDVALLPLIVGFIASFVSALLVVQLLLQLMKKASYQSLAVLRVALGLLILVI